MSDNSFRRVSASMLLSLAVFLACTKGCLSGHTKTFLVTPDLKRCIGITINWPNFTIESYNCVEFNRYQWFFVEGSLQWEGNRTYCLAPLCEKKLVTLKPCTSENGRWRRGREFSLYNTLCSRLTLTEVSFGRLSLLPYGSIGQQNWLLLEDLKKDLFGSAPVKYPMTNKPCLFHEEMMKALVNRVTPLSRPFLYDRDVATFPGKIRSSTPRVSLSFSLRASHVKLRKYRMKYVPLPWRPTDLYAAPGDMIEVIVPKLENALQPYHMRIGSYPALDRHSPNAKSKFLRMPVVSDGYTLRPGVNQLRSQYGGNLIFPYSSIKKTVRILIKNVVEAPYFELGVTTNATWKNMKGRDAPTAVLVGRKCVIIANKKKAESLKDPQVLLSKYDGLVAAAESLSGFDKLDPPPPVRYWFINDIQTPAGIVFVTRQTYANQNFPNVADQTTPDRVAIWKAIGYTFQQPVWARAFHPAAVASLFSMYIHKNIYKQNTVNKTLRDAAHKDLREGETYESVRSLEKLVFFDDLMRAAPSKGWGIFRFLHRAVRRQSKRKLDIMYANVQQQRDFVYKALSYYAETDFFPVFKFWGIMVSPSAQRSLQTLRRKKGLRLPKFDTI